MISGFNSEKRVRIVSSEITNFLGLLNDSSPKVQYVCLCSLNTICDLAGVSILKHQNFIQILQMLVEKIKISELHLKQVSYILRNLCRVCKEQGLQNFTSIAGDLISVLIQESITPNSSLQSLNDAMLAIMDLLDVSGNSELHVKQINFILDNFSKLGSLQQEKREEVESGFLTIIQTCLLCLTKGGDIGGELLEKIYKLVINHFTKKN